MTEEGGSRKNEFEHGAMALVLHRVVAQQSEVWEDITESTLRIIVDRISSSWATFSEQSLSGATPWLLTFDDGFSSDYENTFPILDEKCVKASFFLISDRIGSEGHLSWSQVVEMKNYGMCIGSHGKSHRRLTSMSVNDAVQELKYSKYIQIGRAHV